MKEDYQFYSDNFSEVLISPPGLQLLLRGLPTPSKRGRGSSDSTASENAVKRLRRTPDPSPDSPSKST